MTPPPKIQSDWEEKLLSEICWFQEGPGVRNFQFTNSGVKLLNGTNIFRGALNLETTTRFISESEARGSYAHFLADEGDVVLASSGITVDRLHEKVAIVREQDLPFCMNTSTIRFKPLDGQVDRDFLFHFLGSSNFKNQIKQQATGSAQLNFGPSHVAKVRIYLPQLPEQRAIAEALGDVDELIGRLERLIAKKRDIKQAVMQHLLTGKTRLPGFTGEWKKVQLRSLGDTYGGLTGKSKQDFGSGNAQYVTFMNVMTNPVIRLDQLESVSVRASENQNRVRQGDLLFNGSSETPEEVAYCALVQDECGEVYLNSFCFGFRPFDSASFDAYFLTALIRSSVGREVMKSLAQGSTRYNISKAALKQGWLSMPPVDEQKAIAQVVKDSDSEIDAMLTRLSKTRDIKQGMMQQLLTGNVRLV